MFDNNLLCVCLQDPAPEVSEPAAEVREGDEGEQASVHEPGRASVRAAVPPLRQPPLQVHRAQLLAQVRLLHVQVCGRFVPTSETRQSNVKICGSEVRQSQTRESNVKVSGSFDSAIENRQYNDKVSRCNVNV